MSCSNAMKFGIEKFDGQINFALWKVLVKDVLIQSGLHKTLKENSEASASNVSLALGEDGDLI